MKMLQSKRMLALLICLLPMVTHAGGLPVDLSAYRNYTYYNIKGLRFLLHDSISKDKAVARQCLRNWEYNFSRIEGICPSVTASFKKNNYKIYLYHLPSSRGGMEFIRDNQHRWDKRVNAHVNKGIIIPRAYTYITKRYEEEGFVYLLHEMAHYRHVVMLGEVGGRYDNEIRRAYSNSLRNPRYKGTYARKNHLEYFAEISMAYLLKKHTVSVFPSGSYELYTWDRVGYNLCKRMWGADLAAYKPNTTNRAWAVVAHPPVSQSSFVTLPGRPFTSMPSMPPGYPPGKPWPPADRQRIWQPGERGFGGSTQPSGRVPAIVSPVIDPATGLPVGARIY